VGHSAPSTAPCGSIRGIDVLVMLRLCTELLTRWLNLVWYASQGHCKVETALVVHRVTWRCTLLPFGPMLSGGNGPEGIQNMDVSLTLTPKPCQREFGPEWFGDCRVTTRARRSAAQQKTAFCRLRRRWCRKSAYRTNAWKCAHQTGGLKCTSSQM
jgi:hypothetical protein